MSDTKPGLESGASRITSESRTPELLRPLGITLPSITSGQVDSITDRDFKGVYPNLSLFGSLGRYPERIGLQIGEFLVGFGVAGTYTKDRRYIGEVGMIHISKPVRRQGLGTLLSLYMREKLLTRNPRILYTAEGDETGAVRALLKRLEYEETGKTTEGVGRHPVWEKDLSNERDRDYLKRLIEKEIELRAASLEPKKGELLQAAERVDRDNPHKVDVEQAIEHQVAKLDMVTNIPIRTLFGYTGSLLQIGRSGMGKPNEYLIYAHIKNTDPASAKKLLEEMGTDGNGLKVDPVDQDKPISREADGPFGNTRVTITSNWSGDSETLKHYVRVVAKIGKRIFSPS